MSDVSAAQKIATVFGILGVFFFAIAGSGSLQLVSTILDSSLVTTLNKVQVLFSPITMGLGGLFAISSALANGGKGGCMVAVLGFLAFGGSAVFMGIGTKTMVDLGASFTWTMGLGWASVACYLIGFICSAVSSKSDSYDDYNY